MSENGDIEYVTWDHQVDATKFYTEAIKQNIEEELQLPNLSFDNVKDISAITEGARKTLLADAHLKVEDESGDLIEFLDRECNVIKEFLGKINTGWTDILNDLEVEHIITPFTRTLRVQRLRRSQGNAEAGNVTEDRDPITRMVTTWMQSISSFRQKKKGLSHSACSNHK